MRFCFCFFVFFQTAYCSFTTGIGTGRIDSVQKGAFCGYSPLQWYLRSYSPLAATCGGSLYGHGTFSSPNYPSYYYDNTNCVWQLRTASDQRILLSFTFLQWVKSRSFFKIISINEWLYIRITYGEMMQWQKLHTDLKNNINMWKKLPTKIQNSALNW